MNRISLGVLVLLLPLPPLRGEDKPPSLRQQYDALVKESQQARQAFYKASREAKTKEEDQKASKDYESRTRRIAAELFTIAAKNPKDPLAIDALGKVLTLDVSTDEKKKAANLLAGDYLLSDKISPLCRYLATRNDDASEILLRRILSKNPHRSVQAEASFALAHMLEQRYVLGIDIKTDLEHTELLERFAGKSVIEELRKKDMDSLEIAVEKSWSEFAEKYSVDIPEERLWVACAWLSYSATIKIETALRTLEKDKRRSIQGIASLTLGQILKRRADALAEKGDKAAAKFRAESAEKLSRAADKYSDVKIMWSEENFGGLVGDKAKKELYELRHLSIGMKVPEIEGEDQDGKKFKLSDYRGKVVLLDFWNRH
jgi:hypothetical protein